MWWHNLNFRNGIEEFTVKHVQRFLLAESKYRDPDAYHKTRPAGPVKPDFIFPLPIIQAIMSVLVVKEYHYQSGEGKMRRRKRRKDRESSPFFAGCLYAPRELVEWLGTKMQDKIGRGWDGMITLPLPHCILLLLLLPSSQRLSSSSSSFPSWSRPPRGKFESLASGWGEGERTQWILIWASESQGEKIRCFREVSSL